MRETYEVEVKIPIDDKDKIIEEIKRAKAKKLKSEKESDMYFDHPCRSFSNTDEAVRLRRVYLDDAKDLDSSSVPAELTYKGPKVDKKTKTRLEYNSAVGDADAIVSFLQQTGFKHIGNITKHRIFYELDDIIISIDDVVDVGLFVEFELIAHSNEEMVHARERILTLIANLGLDPEKTVRESYLELYFQEKRH